ncbi:RNA chaperone Hfq [Athalassotoga saccharophila]|uniref:RNA chaperone Hfq n=1 Tax=Athalassotoga saccharophila TaxID=1441386 RepID=UPI0013795D6F|nr:RNA chaperone Hfq [Athalassotoga saccharophila]BBJ27918.1 RNA-binding protein Hfq [Athalassotoga saccharophila]
MEKQNLQDKLLNYLRKKKIEAKVYLVNGFQVKGLVKSFDNYTVLIESGRQQNMVYKHAISTIIPSEYLELEEVIGKKSLEEEEKTEKD